MKITIGYDKLTKRPKRFELVPCNFMEEKLLMAMESALRGKGTIEVKSSNEHFTWMPVSCDDVED